MKLIWESTGLFSRLGAFPTKRNGLEVTAVVGSPAAMRKISSETAGAAGSCKGNQLIINPSRPAPRSGIFSVELWSI